MRIYRANIEISFPRADKALNQEIMLSLLDWGLRLRFLPVSQTLYLIDHYDISLKKIAIKGSIFGGDLNPTTFEMLQKNLGPTLPGMVVEDNFYLSDFGGASFLFCIPTARLTEVRSHLPIVFSDGSSPLLNRIYIYPHDLEIANPKGYSDFLTANTIVIMKPNERYPNGVLKVRNHPAESFVDIQLGLKPQYLISALGDPTTVAMNQNSRSYRYEYAVHGFEFHFSELTHRLFQIVLRNNLARCADFGRFDRCSFRIYFDSPFDLFQTPIDEDLIRISSPRSRKEKGDEKSKNVSTTQMNEVDCEKDRNFDVILGPSNENAFIDPLSDDIHIRTLMNSWFGTMLSKESAAQIATPQGCPFEDSILFAYPEVIHE